MSKPKMCYSLSITEKEKVHEVDFVIWTVYKNISKKRAQLDIRNSVSSNDGHFSIWFKSYRRLQNQHFKQDVFHLISSKTFLVVDHSIPSEIKNTCVNSGRTSSKRLQNRN